MTDAAATFGAWLNGQPAQQQAPAPILAPVNATDADQAYAIATLKRLAGEVAMATPGSINATLNERALRAYRVADANGLDRQIVTDTMKDAVRRAGGTDTAKDESTLRSARNGADKYGPAPKDPGDGNGRTSYGNTDFGPVDAADIRQTVDDDDIPPVATLEQIEDGFWKSREHLTLIYDAAIARMASPWAVLACCMARALALVPPHIVLPPIIGDVGSLNWFAAISAKSGGGKGAAMAVAKALMPQEVLMRGIGSGEGMVEVYQRSSPDKKDPPPPVPSVLFSIEEIDSLGAMGGRSGQTTMAVLRQGFSGEKLGYSYRGRQGETVAEHSYRMTVVASVQPERAGVLFEDAGGGTPQRFMWFPGRDKRIKPDPPPWPDGQLSLPRALEDYLTEAEITGPGGTLPLKQVTVPAAAAQTIRAARAQSMSGDDDALNSHALFCREKFAFGLALLAGRVDAVTADDWRLSGTAAAVSDWCRTKAQEGYASGRHRQARDRGELRGIENDERAIVETLTYQMHIARITRLIVKHIEKDGPQSAGALRKRQRSTDKPRFAAALTAAAEAGLVVQRDDAWVLP